MDTSIKAINEHIASHITWFSKEKKSMGGISNPHVLHTQQVRYVTHNERDKGVEGPTYVGAVDLPS
jgi:hypothetical protein